MKKLIGIMFILALVLSIAMLSACGGGKKGGDGAVPADNPAGASSDEGVATSSGSGDDVGSTAPKYAGVIKPSELITAEDATSICEMDMEAVEGETDVVHEDGLLETMYWGDDGGSQWVSLKVTFAQDGLSFIKSAKEEYGASGDAAPVPGVGDWACLTGNSTGMAKFLYIAVGDYYIEINLTGTTDNGGRSAVEDGVWKIEKITEAGKLAVERLENIVG